MIYKKPKDVKYVDMCKFIDDNIYRDDLSNEEEELIYQYLYLLINMFARKYRFFDREVYYEDFSIYTATYVYMRYKNKKQFEFNDNGQPKLSQIKSVLNYIKKILYPRKIEFQQEFFSQVDVTCNDQSCDSSNGYTLSDQLSDSVSCLQLCDFSIYLEDICKTIKSFLSGTPYKDAVSSENIYLSCLLTFLNSITLSGKDIEYLSSLDPDALHTDVAINNRYKKQTDDCVILYHLDPSMKNYIATLTKEVKHILCQDLTELLHTDITVNSSENMLRDREFQREVD